MAHAIERLVEQLGLKTDLKAWGVPRGDLGKIAEGALEAPVGRGKEDERFGSVLRILEGMYPD